MSNRIEILLSGKLSSDTQTNINKQIKELQKQLDTLTIDANVLKDLKELQQLKIENSGINQLQKDLGKAQEEAKKLKDELNAVKEKTKEEQPIITPEIDDKKVRKNLENLTRLIESHGGKIEYDIDTSGSENKVKSLTAVYEEFGKKRREVFRPTTDGDWVSDRLKQEESTIRDTTRLYDQLAEKLKKSSEESKITEEQFARMNRELEKVKNSQNGINELSKSLSSLERHNDFYDRLVKNLEKLVSTGKISRAEMEEQKKLISEMGTLNKKKYDEMLHQATLMVNKNKERTKALREEQQAIEARNSAELAVLKLQNQLERVTKNKPKVQEYDEYVRIAQEVQRISFNQTSMSAEELRQAIKRTSVDIDSMSAKATEAGRTQVGMVQAFKIALEKFPVWVATSTMFYGSIRSARKFMEVIVDIDTKMTDLRKVMADDTDFGAVFDRAKESAEQFGQTISETMDSYIEFAKQGYEGDELGFLADAAVVAGNVADMPQQQAAEYLTASLIQWQKEANEAMDVIDKWNEISNNFATTTENLAQGQARAGSVAKTMGLEFEELNGIVAVTTAMTKQSGNEIGNFIKSVLPRLTSAPAKKALEMVNVELTDAEGNLRNIITIFKEVAQNIKELNTSEQTEVLEGLAGKYHISRISALIDDLGQANSMFDQVMASQMDATGSAVEENEEYLKSYQARINEVRRRVEELSLALGEAFLNDTMTAAISAASSALQSLVGMIEKVGALPPLLTVVGLGTLALSKNVRGMADALLFGTKNMSKSQLELLQLTEGMNRAEVASAALKRGLKGVALGLAGGAISFGLGLALEHFISKAAEAKQRSDELSKTLREQSEAYGESREGVQDLFEHYQYLEQQLQKGQLSREERLKYTQQLKKTQQELAETFPEMVMGESEYGETIYETSSALESRIELAERQYELQKQMKELEESQERIELFKTIDDDIKKAQKSIQYFDLEVSEILERLHKSGGMFSKVGDLEGVPKFAKDLEGAEEALRRIIELQQEAGAEGDTKRVEALEKFKHELQIAIADYEHSELEITNLTIHYANERSAVLKNLMGETFEFTPNMEGLINAFDTALGQADLTKQEIQTVFDSLEINIVDKMPDVKHYFSEYEQVMTRIQELRQQFENEEDSKIRAEIELDIKDAYLQAQQLGDSIREVLMDSLSEANIDEEIVANIEKTFYQLNLATIASTTGMQDFKDVAEDTGIPLEDLDSDLLMTGEAFDDVGESAEEAGDKVESFALVLETVLGLAAGQSVDDLTDLQEEFIAIANLLPLLEEGTDAYNVALEQQDVLLEQLFESLPLLRDAYEDQELSQEEIIALLNEEMETLEFLDTAIQANAEGKLTADEQKVLSSYLAAQEQLSNDDEYIRGIDENTDRLIDLLEKRKKQVEQKIKETGGVITAEIRELSAQIDDMEAEVDRKRGEHASKAVAAQEKLQKELAAIGNKYADLGNTKAARERARKAAEAKREAEKAARERERAAKKAQQEREKAAREAKRKQDQAKREAERARKERERAVKQAEKAGVRNASSMSTAAIDREREAQERAREAERQRKEEIRKLNEAKREAIRLAEEYARENETASFMVDKHTRALEELNLALKEQQLIKDKFPEHSYEYQDALKNELALEQQKLNVLKAQSDQQAKDLRNRKVTKYGVVDAPETMRRGSTQRLSGWGVAAKPVLQDEGDSDKITLPTTYSSLQSNVEGIVKKAFRDAKQGNVVVIVDNKGNEHRFKDLNKVNVRAGQKVNVGSNIGNYREYAGLSYVDHNYAIRSNSGNLINPNEWIKNARNINNAGAGQTTVGNLINVSKEEAQKAQELYQLESNILSMQGDILEQQAKIEKIQLALIQSELARFDLRRKNYDRNIDFELVKYAALDKASERHTAVVARQTMFMEYKQQVNLEEIQHLKELISYGGLQGKALEEVTDRYNDLRLTVKETTIELSKMRKQWIDSQLVGVEREVESLDFEIAKLGQTIQATKEGSYNWTRSMQDQIYYFELKRNAIRQEIEQLTELIRVSHQLTPDDVEEYNKKLRQLTLEYRQLGITIQDANEQAQKGREKASEEIANKVVEAYKKALQEMQAATMQHYDELAKSEDKRHNKVMENYRKELDEYRKVIDDKIREMDRAENRRTYRNEMEELGEERQKLLSQLNILSLDDSREAKYERERLQQQLVDLDKEMEEKRHRNQLDIRKESLNDMMETKTEEINDREKQEEEYHKKEKERIEEQREWWNQYYIDRLNDEKKFADMREAVISGNIDSIRAEFEDLRWDLLETIPALENTLNGTMQAVGTMIRRNVIDELEEALRLYREFQYDMGYNFSSNSNQQSMPNLSAGLPSQQDQPAGLSYADSKVVVGKYIRDKMPDLVENPYRKAYIKEHGANLANTGRAEGSDIDNIIRYEPLIANMSREDMSMVADMMDEYANQFIMPELREHLRSQAKRLRVSASFDTGGYTGSWSGNDGRLAMLHKEELVLNTKETHKFGDLLSQINSASDILKAIQDKETLQQQKIENTTIHVNVDRFMGTREEANYISEILNQKIKRERGTR